MDNTLRSQFPICFRKVFKKNVGGIAAVIFIWAIGSFFVLKTLNFTSHPDEFLSSGHRIWILWVAVLFLLIFWRTGYEILYFITYFYDMDKNNVLVRKGVFAKTEVTLPFSKITDVYVDQDVMDVIFGLYDLHISTPTAESGHLAHVDGLSRYSAMTMKKIILERINAFGEQEHEAPPTDTE